MTNCRLDNKNTHIRSGVALLEAGAWLAVVSFLLVGAIAWGVRINEQADVETIVRNEIRRLGVSGATIDSSGEVILNSAELTLRQSSIVQNVVAALRDHNFDGILHVKACYWVAPTDVLTGHAQFNDSPVCTVFGNGDGLFPPSEMSRIRHWFEGAPAVAAIPIRNAYTLKFAGFSVLLGIGVRVEREFTKSLWDGLPGDIDYTVSFLPSGDIRL